MRYFDINDNELSEEELDFENGYCEDDKIFIQHHDAIPAEPRKIHYAVNAVYFEDGSSYQVSGEDDPRIVADDASLGRFHFHFLDGEEPKEVRGMDLYEVEDSPEVEAVKAWDEYEDIQRYKLYTPEEKAAKEEADRVIREREEVLATGAARLAELEQLIEDHKTEILNTAISIENTEFDLLDTRKTIYRDLNETTAAMEDLTLCMADLLGVEE